MSMNNLQSTRNILSFPLHCRCCQMMRPYRGNDGGKWQNALPKWPNPTHHFAANLKSIFGSTQLPTQIVDPKTAHLNHDTGESPLTSQEDTTAGFGVTVLCCMQSPIQVGYLGVTVLAVLAVLHSAGIQNSFRHGKMFYEHVIMASWLYDCVCMAVWLHGKRMREVSQSCMQEESHIMWISHAPSRKRDWWKYGS